MINPIGNFFIFWLGSFTKVAIVGGCPQIIRKLEKMFILLYLLLLLTLGPFFMFSERGR